MHWLPRSVGRKRAGKFKHAGIFLHNPVLFNGEDACLTAYPKAECKYPQLISFALAQVNALNTDFLAYSSTAFLVLALFSFLLLPTTVGCEVGGIV